LLLRATVASIAIAGPAFAQIGAGTGEADFMLPTNPPISYRRSQPQSDQTLVVRNYWFCCCRLSAQPVVPFSLSNDSTIIHRTILLIAPKNVTPGTANGHCGRSETTGGFFSPPSLPTKGGLIGGAELAFLPPRGPDALPANSSKWGLGPTILALKQTNY